MRTLILILLATFLLASTSCKRVVIKVDSIPGNTPPGQPIYITGNFNNWDPGEELYVLQMSKDSNYYYTLPPGFGTVFFKFTRGDWNTVEKDICGEEIENRLLETAFNDTIICKIESWTGLDPIDCPKLTLKIDNIPENTPIDDLIALASNANSWDPDNASIFEKTISGDLLLTIDRPPGVNTIDYKITRGNLSTSESDEYGNEIPIRTLKFGSKDTIYLDVKGWTDIPETKSNRVVIIIKKLPNNTFLDDGLFLACNINSWSAGDKNYQFQQNKNGQWFYPVPRKETTLDYKITRGEWGSVEVDRSGNDIENRSLNLQNEDTVYVEIKGWKDIESSTDNEIIIILDSIPKSTPSDAKFYLTGNFNGWNPGRLRHKFRLNDKGQYYVSLPREFGDLACKVTRGSWETSEVGTYGEEIPNFYYNYNDFDTLVVNVANWKDKPKFKLDNITLVINKLPTNTPSKDHLYLAPDFNGWNPGDKKLIFSGLPDGRPYITFPAKGPAVEYKITRGNWSTVETNQYGDDIEDHVIFYGFADTVYIDVIAWRDFDGNY